MKIKYKFSRMGNSFLNSHLRTSKLMIMFKHSLLLSWNYCILRKHRLSWAWPLFHIRHLSSPLWQKRTLADASLFISWQTKNLRKKSFRHSYITRKEKIQGTDEKCLFWNSHTYKVQAAKTSFWIILLLSRKMVGLSQPFFKNLLKPSIPFF